jgi:single-stranded-DNA-specific exonuclease
MDSIRFDIAACPAASVSRLQKELGISSVIAQVLVRRGLTDPQMARDFLSCEVEHDASEFAGMPQIVERLLAHVSEASLITVHGDYDVDGVCSTAVLVRALQRLGGNVDWYLPDRSSDGYGLNPHTIERLTARGTRLLLTADCAITAVAEVALARANGLEVIVTDHHTPPADGSLPDALILHPVVCGYPCADLCATGVAYKLAQGLWQAAGRDLSELEEDLDLVALATVADVVALRGENRSFVTRGLRNLSGTAKPGLQALMSIAGVDPSKITERAVGFALAPRLNAAGRLYHADAALELILTQDTRRAGEIAEELHRANQERRHSETRILFEAEAQIAQLGDRPAYVLAGDDWHAGVIGIVASRLAERHRRPVLVIALDEQSGKGSGRSIDSFDLLGALNACGEHLVRYGGHRGAAGVEVERAHLEVFTDAFTAYAQRTLATEDFLDTMRVDAIASGSELGLDLAEELQSLAPFGQGNPPISLLLPAVRFTDPRGMGEGKHLRFTVSSGASCLRAVAFGMGASLPVDEDTPTDGIFALEVNEWKGVSEPRLNLRHAQPSNPEPIVVLDSDAAEMESLWIRLKTPSQGTSAPARSGLLSTTRALHDRRGAGVAGTLCALIAGGEPVLVLSADATLHSRSLTGQIGGFPMCSYATLMNEPLIAADYQHVALLDPPAHPEQHRMALMGLPEQHVHLLWGEAEVVFALEILERDNNLRGPLSDLYRRLRDADGATGDDLREILFTPGGTEGSTGHAQARRPVVLVVDLLRVLEELALIEIDPIAERISILPSERTSLERSETFRRHSERLADGRALLGAMHSQAA